MSGGKYFNGQLDIKGNNGCTNPRKFDTMWSLKKDNFCPVHMKFFKKMAPDGKLCVLVFFNEWI